MSHKLSIVVLLITGVAAMVLEAFVPSFGILGLGGAAAFFTALVMAHDAGSVYGLNVDVPTLVAVGIIGVVFLKASLYFTWKSLRRKLFAGAEVMAGAPARVLHWHDGHGRVHVDGEEWAATGPAHLNTGDEVTIDRRDNLTLIVTPKKDQ